MTRTATRLSLCLALALAMLLASGGRAPSASPSAGSATPVSPEERARIEKEIRGLEASFNGAYERNDLKTYWTFFAPDLAQFFDSGRVGLEQYKKDWSAFIQGGGAILEARIDALEVRVSPLGDAAGASYRLFIKMKDTKGKESSTWYLESDTWFKRDGHWQVGQLHYSEQHQPAQPAAAAAGAGSETY